MRGTTRPIGGRAGCGKSAGPDLARGRVGQPLGLLYNGLFHRPRPPTPCHSAPAGARTWRRPAPLAPPPLASTPPGRARGAPRHRAPMMKSSSSTPVALRLIRWRKGWGQVLQYYIQGLTIMRTPVVKRHTPPKSGFFAFFRRSSGAVILWQRVRTSFPPRGAGGTWLHQTLLEVLSPCERRLQGAIRAFSATEKPIGALVPSSANDRINVKRSPGRGRLG